MSESVCTCHSYSEDMGGGHYALMLEPNPDCPEHFPKEPMSTENIEVIPLGEDGDLWFVTGTRDAHSAWEAAHDYDIAEWPGDSPIEGMDPDLVSIKYRTDWAWVPVNPYHPDDEQFLKSGDDGGDNLRFNGFLVSA